MTEGCAIGGPPFCALCRLPLDVEERYRRAVWEYPQGERSKWKCPECGYTAWSGKRREQQQQEVAK